jgi:multiple sugar transport system permease protein
MSTATIKPTVGAPPTARRPRPRVRPARAVLHTFLVITAACWLIPVVYALYTSLRPYADTQRLGYVSIGGHYNFSNFSAAWTQGQLWMYFKNSMFVTVPALLLILLFSSMVAFVVARYSFKINLALLLLFTAGNLLPQQALITPLFKMYLLIPMPAWLSDSGSLDDTYLGLIIIHVAFQTGFCTFVLSNFMRTVPHEITEAANVDGASALRQYWQIILPLCRPALAALATLEFTWIYNDFFWATVLMQTGANRPITAALANLQGQFFTNNNLVAAASLIVAFPTLVVFFALQRHFVSGLTLGSTKG